MCNAKMVLGTSRRVGLGPWYQLKAFCDSVARAAAVVELR